MTNEIKIDLTIEDSNEGKKSFPARFAFLIFWIPLFIILFFIAGFFPNQLTILLFLIHSFLFFPIYSYLSKLDRRS